MDFELTSEQRLLRDQVVRFARNELDGEGGPAEPAFSRQAWERCGEMGLPGLPVPEEYGGSGLEPLDCAIALEAFGYGCRDNGLVFSVCAHLLSCVVPIWRHGTEAQKRRYLPGMCSGSIIGVNAMTEPGSGSDAFALRTTACRDGDGFVLTGAKTLITNAPVGDLAVVFAATDPSRGYHGGVTAFLVEMDAPGMSASAPIEKLGLRSSPLGEVVLDGVRVGPDAVLGGVGGGADIFTHSMNWERTCLFASHVGMTERLLESALAHARTRTQFGQSIGKYQAVSHRLADMKVRLEAARLLVYRAASRLERTRTVTLDAAMAKLFVSESLVEAALGTLQVHGGYGYTVEYGVERVLRDALGSTLYSGTSEMQRNIIASWLGL